MSAQHRRETNLAEVFVLPCVLDPNSLTALAFPPLFGDEQTFIPFENLSSRFQCPSPDVFPQLFNETLLFCHHTGVKLSNCFSRLRDSLLVHGTTHFSISSNPVFHFSDSEKKPLKQKLPEYIECRTILLVLSLIHYSKQCHLK